MQQQFRATLLFIRICKSTVKAMQFRLEQVHNHQTREGGRECAETKQHSQSGGDVFRGNDNSRWYSLPLNVP